MLALRMPGGKFAFVRLPLSIWEKVNLRHEKVISDKGLALKPMLSLSRMSPSTYNWLLL